MSLNTYERNNTFKSTVEFKSGSTYIDPSANKAYIDVYDPLGNLIIGNEEGEKVSTGIYKYYISTQGTDDLGIYRIRWHGLFNYQGRFSWSPKYESEAVQIVLVDQ